MSFRKGFEKIIVTVIFLLKKAIANEKMLCYILSKQEKFGIGLIVQYANMGGIKF